MRRGVVIAVALAGGLALAACDDRVDGPADSASTPSPAAAAVASPPATTTAAASADANATASVPASPTVSLSPQLTAALNTLSEKARAVGAPSEVRDKIQAGNDALGVARASVNRMRDNAYGSAKNCSVVIAQRSVAVSNASAAAGDGSAALRLLPAWRGAINELTDATNAVEATVAAEGTSMDALPSVKQAVTSARQQVSDENSSADKMTDGANALVSNGGTVRGNAEQIAGKAC